MDQEPQPRIDGRTTEAALRASEERYRSLFDTMAEGVAVVELVRDVSGTAVDVIHHELNAALERQSGLRREEALGRRMSELQSVEDTMTMVPLMAAVADTGEPATFEQYVEQQQRWYEITAYPRGGDWLTLFYRDVSKRKRAEEALRLSEAQHAFMLRLADAFRPLADPAVIQMVACRLLGEQLGVDRAYYVDIDVEAGIATVEHDHLRADSPSLAGRHRIADFGWVIPPMRRGETLVIPDVAASPLVPAADRPLMEAVRIAAHVNAPLLKDGELVGALCVTECVPRAWTAAEVEIVRETGERIWSALEWARTEQARRESDERYRTLFESIDEGFGIVEVIFDDSDEAVDFRFLETNPAFSVQSGLIGAEGRRLRELVPEPEPFWFDTYGRIARTGRPERFRQQAEALGERWYDAYAFRIGKPEEHKVAFVFTDVTDQIQAMEALRQSEQRFRRFGEASFDVLWIRSAESLEVEYLSPAFETIYGCSAAAVMGAVELWIGLIAPADRQTVRAHVRAARSGEASASEYLIHRPDGDGRWIRTTIFPIVGADGSIERIGGIERDITVRRQFEAELQQLNESLEERVSRRTRQVRELTRRLTMAEQEERQRISLVLHDDLQQVLYGIEGKISSALAGTGGDVTEDMEAAQRWIKRAIATTRQLSVDLSPPILRDEGLVDALQWLRRQMEEIHGLHVEIEGEKGVRLPDDVRVLLFQTIRELLFNVKKHARTDRATVSVQEADDELVICVRDRGHGFESHRFDKESDSSGFGLFTARERLHLLGGSLEIHSRPGSGTEVAIRLPLPLRAEDG